MIDTNLYTNCLLRQQDLLDTFAPLLTPQARYQKIIEMGRTLPPAPEFLCQPQHLVQGCQSEVYLVAYSEDKKIFFHVYTEALISAGLASLLLAIYNGESAETILTCPPNCLQKLGISASLSPARSNGLFSIHLRMKQEALRLCV